MDHGLSDELLLEVDHVKYRKAGEGRSPVGRLYVYTNFVEWKDNASPDKLQVKFALIKGQRVSPPNKDKVQLQLVLQNDDQATFVFLDPGKSKEQKIEQRDMLKETLQQALINHRARVNELVASQEKGSKTAELEAKRKILLENEQLNALFHHLVVSKLITTNEFWGDHFNSAGSLEETTGVNGAFLSTIAQQEGTNGIKLNLNADIIRAIFNTYPAVERKHLELVPHELTEQQFWSKFFQSHYYHREREVLPNPNDPFADCVRLDDAEIETIVKAGVDRKRFDLNSLGDNTLAEYDPKTESINKGNAKTTLVRRCNYLSERIVSFLKTVQVNGETNGNPAKTGFSMLNRIVDEEEERLESSELISNEQEHEGLGVQIGAIESVAKKTYPEREARGYKRKIVDFLEEFDDEDLFKFDNDLFESDVRSNGYFNGKNGKEEKAEPKEWDLSPKELTEVRNIHEAVTLLLKHFWLCFPAVNPELESKVERIYESLIKYRDEQLVEATANYGGEYLKHCYDLIDRATEKYSQFSSKRKK